MRKIQIAPKALPLLSEIKRRFSVHGINVQSQVLCPITLNKHWRYGTCANAGGGHNHFDTKDSLYLFLLQVEYVATICDV